MTIRRNYQFNAGTISIPVPAQGRPEGCPETIDLQLGTLTVSWDEQVEFDLDSAKSAKQAALDAWWINHPGVTITASGQTVTLSVQKTDVAVNRLEILSATLEQRAAKVFNKAGLPVTIQLADLATATTSATAAIEAELTKFYAAQAAIEAASNEAEINAVAMPAYPAPT